MTTRQTVTIQGPDDRAKIVIWARNVEPGTVVTFRKKSRSTEQSAKMWAMLHEVAEQVEWYGQKIDAEDWKDMFTASLRHARVVPGIDKGTFVPLGMHTSTMTIEEMTNLIELIYAFGADPEHPVIFKDPKQDTDDAPSSPSTSSDAAGEPKTSTDSPAATLSETEWLKTAARMLWAATNVGKDTDANLSVLNVQRLCVGDLCPPDATQATKDKAGSIYKNCKKTVLSEQLASVTLRIIAGISGLTELEVINAQG